MSNVERSVQHGPRSAGGNHWIQVTEWRVDDDPERWVELVTTPLQQIVSSARGSRAILPAEADPTNTVNSFLEAL